MEAMFAIAVVVALVWVAVVFLRGGLLGGCLAVLIASSLFSRPFFFLDTEPIPLTVDRVLWIVLMIQCLVWRRVGRIDAKPCDRAEIALTALVGVLVASTFLHDWRANGAQAAAWLLFFYLMPVGVYWVARQIKLTERGVLVTFGVLAALGCYLALTALAETCQLWWLVFPQYIASHDYQEFLGRARGPFLSPIACGFFQGVCLCAALMWWPRVNRPGKLMIVLFAALLCFGTYNTLTRSTWMGLGMALFVVAGLSLPRSCRLPVLGAGVLLVALMVATQWNRLVAFKRDRGLSARETASSVELRPILARVAWNMFCDRPLFGCGFGQYSDVSIFYLADRSTELPLEKARPYRQHNAFLALVTETGLVGMGLFASVLVLWGRDAWRLWRSGTAPLWARQQGLFFLGVLGVYLPNALFHEVSIIPAFHILFFLTAGMTAGLRHMAQPAVSAASPRDDVGVVVQPQEPALA